MKNLKTYWRDNSELAEYEALNKGYCLDIYVEKDNNLFNVSIYDIVRLKQDFESEMKCDGFYSIDKNLILVEDVKREDITMTINCLGQRDFFEQLKPLYNNKIFIDEFIKRDNLIEI